MNRRIFARLFSMAPFAGWIVKAKADATPVGSEGVEAVHRVLGYDRKEKLLEDNYAISVIPTQEHFEMLKAANPLFSGDVHFPQPYKDFRGLTFPCEFRAGPYRSVREPTKWKMLLGQRSDAESCQRTLAKMGIASVIEEPPVSTFMQITWEMPTA